MTCLRPPPQAAPFARGASTSSALELEDNERTRPPSYAATSRPFPAHLLASSSIVGPFVAVARPSTPVPPAPAAMMRESLAWMLVSVVEAPVEGATAIAYNFIGDKILAPHFAGYAFFGGSHALNYFYAGLALSVVLHLRAPFGRKLQTAGISPAPRAMVLLAAYVLMSASVGALGAAIGEARGEAGQSPKHAAIAATVPATIFGAAAALFLP